MCCRFEFYCEREVASPDCGKQFLTSLDRTLRPTVLLRLEAVHIHRQLSRCDHVRKEDELPARKLRAITQIQVFRERVMLPAACFLDAGASPQTSRSIEIEETPAAASRRLLQQEMPIEKHRLDAREQRVAAIEMAPTCLDHSHLRVGKKMDRLA